MAIFIAPDLNISLYYGDNLYLMGSTFWKSCFEQAWNF